MARSEQRIGASGEQLVENRLRAIGFDMIEKIGTPIRMTPLPTFAINALRRMGINTNGIFRVAFGDKVAGDRRAIINPSGRSVLIETKTILNRNLRYSDLRKHQPGKLDEHSVLGGISILAWVHESGVYIMQWPVPGFQKGKSIKTEQAQSLNIMEVSQCR